MRETDESSLSDWCATGDRSLGVGIGVRATFVLLLLQLASYFPSPPAAVLKGCSLLLLLEENWLYNTASCAWHNLLWTMLAKSHFREDVILSAHFDCATEYHFTEGSNAVF